MGGPESREPVTLTLESLLSAWRAIGREGEDWEQRLAEVLGADVEAGDVVFIPSSWWAVGFPPPRWIRLSSFIDEAFRLRVPPSFTFGFTFGLSFGGL